MTEPRLNRRLSLEDPVLNADGAGGYVQSWIPLGVLWAEIRPGSGRERGEDFLTVSSVPYRITVRAAPFGAPSRPKPEQRFRDGSRIFRILAVAERAGNARFLTCFAKEEVAA